MPGEHLPDGLTALATYAEMEGTSVIALALDLEGFDIRHEGPWARISLGLASELSGIGLTAAISTALADAAIPCNVVAAYHHDHVFVPWDRREEAFEILKGL